MNAAIVVLVSLIVSFILGTGTGWMLKDKRCDAAMAEAKATERIITKLQPVVTEKIVTKYVDRVIEIEGKGLYVKEIIEVAAPPAKCDWPGAYRLLHDAAARNQLPSAGWETNATAPDVDAATFAKTVDANYRLCHANAAQLESLQQWIKEQRELAR